MFASLFWRIYDYYNVITYWRLVVWFVGLVFSRFVEYDVGVVVVYRCVIFFVNILNVRRISIDDINFMGRFFYYRYRFVVLYIVVDYRFF